MRIHGVVLLLASAGASAAPPLAVRLGLWEARIVGIDSGFLSGAPAGERQQHLTPEQQARMEAARQRIKDRLRAGIRRYLCVTSEDLKDNRLFSAEPAGAADTAACPQTAIAATATHREFTMECSGAQPLNAHVTIDVITPEQLRAEATAVRGTGPDAGKLVLTSEAKWVRSDCGNVMPRSYRGKVSGAAPSLDSPPANQSPTDKPAADGK